MSQDGLTIMFEHCTARARPAAMPPAASSAPHTPTGRPAGCPTEDAASEDCWNLIPYDVPWGPEYYHYRTGTLPGPDGACLFLRSPTPLKNRRTQKACNKCRQRKAKCSGGRPTCSRCLARGYHCEYAEEEPKRPSHGAGQSRHRDSHSQRDPSEEPSDETEYSSTEAESPSPSEPPLFAPRPLKLEESELATPDLMHTDSPDSSDSASPSADYCSPWEDATYPCGGLYGSHSPSESFGDLKLPNYYNSPSYAPGTNMEPYQTQHLSQQYFPQAAPQLPAAVHAPRPVRCTGSPTFLSPHEQQAHLASSCEPSFYPHDDMLINMSAASEPAPQIAIPQLPSMPSADLAAVHGGAVEYAHHPQEMYYCPAPMPPYPFLQLQYQYPISGYMHAPQDNVEPPPMLYTMVPSGMAS
ncbi:hypothetical protein C8Q77DRAFT_1216753 [Trametes polyzona]|nr:hypothetical protein C8Q77DRAFT_1216753 [Trametes polyzona]